MGKDEAFHASCDAKIVKNKCMGCCLNFTTHWGCSASDTALRRPLLILVFTLVIASVICQKFAFIGLLVGAANTENFPWIKAEVEAHTLWRIFVDKNYTGGQFVDPFGILNWQNAAHEALTIDVASPTNPRNLVLVPTKQSITELCMYPYGAGWSTGGANNVDLSGRAICRTMEDVANAVGDTFPAYADCNEASTGLYGTLVLGVPFGLFGMIDCFTRWSRYYNDKPNDRGHFKCVGGSIFIFTLLVDFLGFTTYQRECLEQVQDQPNIYNPEMGLGYIMLWMQFFLNHAANIVKLTIPAIDVRELDENGGAKTGCYGQIVQPGGKKVQPEP